MILETHQALATALKAQVLGSAAVGIAFDPPSKAWASSLKGPVVNFFLFDIRENSSRREVMFEEVRDAEGVVVSRRMPPPRFDLHYTVSVWAPKVAVEHRVLAAALRYFGSLAVLPREYLPAPLAALPYDVLIETGRGAKRSMFLNLAGELKVGFELAVTVPMPPPPAPPVAPPVRQPPTVTVGPVPGADPARTVSPQETVTPRPTAPEQKEAGPAPGAGPATQGS